MYTPKHYRVEDFKEIQEFIQENSFGIIVSTDQGRPIATHVPLELHKQGTDYYITGHLAYANPQWKSFEDQDQVLVIFQGPHAYVSSLWYENEDVSTWNYQAVHLYGKVRLMTEDELREDLIKLLDKYERNRENSKVWDNLSSQTKKQIKGIVGFKVKVDEVDASYKLSQNRSNVDYENIVNQLEQEDDMNSKRLAEVMKKHASKRD
ncbi:FMN-binding negative transcriptional regulator [Piscibacillus sp. B03]|uniref:FMN-binding negative transcriptional regulator n=1 Tax=Piscibacillus sp. B03 TaxID=3457430 RepID=UPI003FCE2832